MSDGLGFGANARIALINRGLRELSRLGLAMGAKSETFIGLAGMGDLVLTCTDNQSRNRRMGLALAAGKTIDEAAAEIGRLLRASVLRGQFMSRPNDCRYACRLLSKSIALWWKGSARMTR